MMSHCLKLDKALVQKDSAALSRLLHDEVVIGHSNGFIENKKELLNHVLNEKIIYKIINKVKNEEIKNLRKITRVRRQIDVVGWYNQKEFSLRLSVLEIWKKHKKDWQLWCRQSVEIKKEK